MLAVPWPTFIRCWALPEEEIPLQGAPTSNGPIIAGTMSRIRSVKIAGKECETVTELMLAAMPLRGKLRMP
jgi:hypothetical protein